MNEFKLNIVVPLIAFAASALLAFANSPIKDEPELNLDTEKEENTDAS